MNTKHGVLYKHGFLDADTVDYNWTGDLEEVIGGSSLDTVCDFALKRNLTHLWIMPDAGITPDKEWFNAHDPEKWSLLDNWLYHNIEPPPGQINLLKSVTGWRLPRGGQKQITLCFLGQASWSWAHTPGFAPQSLLEVISRLEYDMGVPVATSPATAGMRYLKATQPAKTDWLRTIGGIPLAEVPWSDGAKNLLWSRELTDEEYERGRYVHKVDKNGMFLRACVEEMFGAGELAHCQVPWIPDGVDPRKAPGIWSVLVGEEPDSLLAHIPLLPPPVWNDSTWLATPLVKLLHKMGYTVDILEGYYFPEYHGTLKHWAENLWKFRQAAKGWPEVRDSYKEIYTSTLGLARSDQVEQDSYKFRPDINAQVVAGARAAMMYNMLKLAGKHIYPVMVYIDSLLFVSEHENVEQAIPGILDHQHSLGGYKHEWTLPLTQAVRDVLSCQLPRNKKLTQLNAWAKEYEVVR